MESELNYQPIIVKELVKLWLEYREYLEIKYGLIFPFDDVLLSGFMGWLIEKERSQL